MNENANENDESAPIPAPHVGAIALAQSVEIVRSGGPATAKVHHFPALTGWEIRRQYKDYLESKDSQFRMAFMAGVLSFVSVETDAGEIFLSNSDIVNEQMESWMNIEKVFNALLSFNGIEIDLADVERRRWQEAGEDLAASFLAAVQSTIGPALVIAASDKGD